MRLYLAGEMPGGVQRRMRLFLAGTERIENDVKSINKNIGGVENVKLYLAGGEQQLKSAIKEVDDNMNLYLAEGDGVASGYLKRLNEENEMKIHLAESGGCLKAYLSEADLYKDTYILQSYFYASEFTEKVILPNCKDFLLDSGAFTFM